MFVNGDYYIPTINPASRKVQYHHWPGPPQVLKCNYNRGNVHLASQLGRLQILYPEPSSLNDSSYYLTIDFDTPRSIEPINVSVYPVVNDCVAVQGTAKTTWYGKVITVDYDNKSVITVDYDNKSVITVDYDNKSVITVDYDNKSVITVDYDNKSVITVDYDNKSVRLKWFNEIRPGILRFTGQFDNVYFWSIFRVISLKETNQGFQMIKAQLNS